MSKIGQPHTRTHTQHIFALGFTRISEWQNLNRSHFHQDGKQSHKGRGEGHNSVSRANRTMLTRVNTLFSLCGFNVCLWETRPIGPVRKDSVSVTGQPTVRAMDSLYSPHFSWLEWNKTNAGSRQAIIPAIRQQARKAACGVDSDACYSPFWYKMKNEWRHNCQRDNGKLQGTAKRT